MTPSWFCCRASFLIIDYLCDWNYNKLPSNVSSLGLGIYANEAFGSGYPFCLSSPSGVSSLVELPFSITRTDGFLQFNLELPICLDPYMWGIMDIYYLRQHKLTVCFAKISLLSTEDRCGIYKIICRETIPKIAWATWGWYGYLVTISKCKVKFWKFLSFYR